MYNICALSVIATNELHAVTSDEIIANHHYATVLKRVAE